MRVQAGLGKTHAAIVVALACASPVLAQTGIAKWRWDDRTEPRGSGLLRETMLIGHNRARAAGGMAPLAWSTALAADAARYAAALAWGGRFAHSPLPRGEPTQGENLWMGTRGAFRFDEMLAAWVDERRFFLDAPTPRFASSGHWQDVAHYTQLMWGRTREVGCALAVGAGEDYLVCRYLPAGNVMGESVLVRDTADAAPEPRLAMRGR